MTETPFPPYRLSICGLSELEYFVDREVSHVVSILDPAFPDPRVFEDYPPHRRVLFRFDDIVEERPGMTYPGEADVARILELGEQLDGDGVTHLLIHCHAGVSRSTATAAILMTRNHPGTEVQAFRVIRHVRPRSWPNSRLIHVADRMLGRDGALIAAMRAYHQNVATEHPDLAALLRLHGRAHEVPDHLLRGHDAA